MDRQYSVRPIGFVRSQRSLAEDDDWDRITAEVVLDQEQFTTDALKEIGSFSHIEVIFLFDQVDPSDIVHGARHPRGRTDWPLAGIFAQRARNRPNRLGVTRCRLVSIEGLTLKVRGLDAIDATPVLDIKPVMSGFEPRGVIFEPQWSRDIMRSYW